MTKLVKLGLLLLIVFLIGLSMLTVSAQVAYATDEETEEEKFEEEVFALEKAKAIKDANDAIRRLQDPGTIVGYEEKLINDVIEAFKLVKYAREAYGAVDSDFENLSKLYEVEKQALKFLAIQEAKDAIDKIPPLSELTEEDREIVEKARHLVNVAILKHGATHIQLCWRLTLLEEAEAKLGKKLEPEPKPEPKPKPKPKPEDKIPTPPTGGMSGHMVMGLLFTGTGFLFIKQRRGRH